MLSEVVKLFVDQQEKGLEKYGELVNLDSYSLVGWIEHTQQECVDKLVYLECVKQKVVERQERLLSP
ncbi:hypothetical protein GK047_07945 [Paenibacillus sp. SYP-B3998]|uniref:Uncharacterized protein n=1 Tax=Paenibacillus sp. SYP-B3998 TaxID=2678564 RepID=A0A6G3ZWH1_9BACL|nr:hypothetical protein [Paenibacillus sp. SYP-B3998]